MKYILLFIDQDRFFISLGQFVSGIPESQKVHHPFSASAFSSQLWWNSTVSSDIYYTSAAYVENIPLYIHGFPQVFTPLHKSFHHYHQQNCVFIIEKIRLVRSRKFETEKVRYFKGRTDRLHTLELIMEYKFHYQKTAYILLLTT